MIIDACNYVDGTGLAPVAIEKTLAARRQGERGKEGGGDRRISSSLILSESISGALLDPFASHPNTRVKEADVDVLMKYCFPPQ